MKLSDLEDAFIFVGGASIGERTAMINRQTGEVLLRSELSDLDEIPEEAIESEAWLEVPHKNELGLGRGSVRDTSSRVQESAGTAMPRPTSEATGILTGRS